VGLIRTGSRRSLWHKAIWVFLIAGLFSTAVWWARAQQELPHEASRFSMARIRFTYPPSFDWPGAIGDSNGPPWSHDWPRSEENIMKIMAEVTKLDVNPGSHITTFETDDCFQYPIAYLCEVGYMKLSAKEAHNMKEYLLRGGFLIVDDFRGNDMDNFTAQLSVVFPERHLEVLPRTDPIFTCFYDVSNIAVEPPYSTGYRPQYLGMRDDHGRLMMVVDYNNDISEYWEWSADPYFKIEDTNEAFKYGVNYIIYALTH
jgi:hypothetical protein